MSFAATFTRLAQRLELALLRTGPGLTAGLRFRGRHHVRTETAFLDLYGQLLADRVLIQSLNEAFNLWELARQTANLGGSLAEFGVYKGGSARLLCGVQAGRPLHLFDTFGELGGMPATRPDIDTSHRQGDFSDSRLPEVRALLAGQAQVHLHPGFFPATAAGLEAERFSFVHLDVDIYQSTLDGLRFFFPRLLPGGILVSHDYSYLPTPGVKRAFDEYFAGTGQSVLRLWDTQCVVVKAPAT
jgi:O-methyltransferase